MLRDRRLRDTELGLNDRAHVTRRLFAIGEELEDSSPDRIAKNIKGMHGAIISIDTYISQDENMRLLILVLLRRAPNCVMARAHLRWTSNKPHSAKRTLRRRLARYASRHAERA